jgi:hypothetical protein
MVWYSGSCQESLVSRTRACCALTRDVASFGYGSVRDPDR